MTRSTLFDRLNQELSEFGKKAQAALDEGKLQIELLRYRRKQDKIARDLGMLIHRRERGGEVEARRVDALLMRLDDMREGHRPAGGTDRRGPPPAGCRGASSRRASRRPSRRPLPDAQVRDTSSTRVAMATRIRSG